MRISALLSLHRRPAAVLFQSFLLDFRAAEWRPYFFVRNSSGSLAMFAAIRT
jgi:hypothetical protein